MTGDSLDATPRQPSDQRDDSMFTLRWTYERADLEDVFSAFCRPRIRLEILPKQPTAKGPDDMFTGDV